MLYEEFFILIVHIATRTQCQSCLNVWESEKEIVWRIVKCGGVKLRELRED